MIEVVCDPLSPLTASAEALRADLARLSLHEPPADLVVRFGGVVSLEAPGFKPFVIDFSHLAGRLQGARAGSEAAGRAVLDGAPRHPTVIDATAGLGRDALVLARLGCKVMMFERHPVIYALLADALRRAQQDHQFRDFPLPRLMPRGSLLDYEGEIAADVIYYDPMFPPRHKSAKVKKEMQMLQLTVGHDTDVSATLRGLLARCPQRVVLKRNALDPVLILGDFFQRSIDGGGCRFDLYGKRPGPKVAL